MVSAQGLGGKLQFNLQAILSFGPLARNRRRRAFNFLSGDAKQIRGYNNAMTRELVHTGKKIQVYVETTTCPDGSTVRRDIVQHPGAVAILPLVDDHHVCLLRNRRPNVGATLLEIPAGTLEPGEAPDRAAIRELAEETGYRANTLQKLCEFYPSPGVLSELTHLFLARQLIPGQMHLEKDEDLEPEIVAWPQALAWALDGTIRDAKTLVAILLWDRLPKR